MQVANPVRRQPRPSSTRRQPTGSPQATAEIFAYIAIRDELLIEAEQLKTQAKLESLSVANDFVVTCLRPARSPYQAQCLAEADAARERKRCEIVAARIAQLRILDTPAAQLRGIRM